ncbi:MAG: Xaa-Pro peptidase family protein [Candidatus Thermoplasmatota archaeon]|nr:Xaa-Pro peptidase family protein [Candidatus Thermoplasmatota archaeon]
MKIRIKKIFENFKEKPDAIIIKNTSENLIDSNFFYVTGLEKGLFEGCAAILFPDGKLDIIVSRLESETAKRANENIKIFENHEEFNIHLKNCVQGCGAIGLNFNGLSYRDYQDLSTVLSGYSFVDVYDALSKTRMFKDELELSFIKKAVDISDKVMNKIPEIIKDGMFEYELAAEINYLIKKLGADKPAFDTISSFGKNSAEPHYTNGETKLKKGDFVLCDFGACFKRYNSDITRTFVFGCASNKQKKMFETVLNAQKKAFEMMKPGITGKQIHNAVDEFINKSDFKGCFIHSTGHSLGLGVHDGSAGLSPISDVKLEKNMVLTVEPGVYIPGFGGVRIEDDILVTSDGIEILSKTPRHLIEI